MGRWFKRKEKHKEQDDSGNEYILDENGAASAATTANKVAKNGGANSFNLNNNQQESVEPPNQASVTQTNNKISTSDDIEQSECFSEHDLHWKHRVLGSCACAFLGSFISSTSFRQMAAYTTSNSQAASVLQATLGNLLVICSSCFWTGPQRQCESMFRDLTRKVSSLVYGGSILTTLTLALVQPPLVSLYYFVLMIVQYISVVVYALSYVPCCKNKLENYVKNKLSRSGRKHSGNLADADANEPVNEGVMA